MWNGAGEAAAKEWVPFVDYLTCNADKGFDQGPREEHAGVSARSRRSTVPYCRHLHVQLLDPVHACNQQLRHLIVHIIDPVDLSRSSMHISSR